MQGFLAKLSLPGKPPPADDEKKPELACFRLPPTPVQMSAFTAFAKKMTAMGNAGLLKQFNEELKAYNGSYTKEIHDKNAKKNRYKDVVCPEASRVIIPDGTYIHANYVRGPPLHLPMICTQGPLPWTVGDFWKMVDQCKVTNIVMLCDTVEMGRPKCEQYFPTTPGQEMTFGDYKVSIATNKSGEPDVKNERTTVTTKLVFKSMTGSTRKVRHFHYKTWPDKATPKSQDILGLLRILQQLRTNTPDCYSLVHCSAGIGRTGTFVAIEMILHQLLGDSTKPFSLVDICKKLRNARPGAIQVEFQYVFMVLCVLEFGTLLKYITDKKVIEDFKKMIIDYDRLIGASDLPPPTSPTTPSPPPVEKDAVTAPIAENIPVPVPQPMNQPGVLAGAQAKVLEAGQTMVRWMANVASTQRSVQPPAPTKDAKK